MTPFHERWSRAPEARISSLFGGDAIEAPIFAIERRKFRLAQKYATYLATREVVLRVDRCPDIKPIRIA